MRKHLLVATALSAFALSPYPVSAAEEAQQLNQEIQRLKAQYQQQIAAMEQRLQQLETAQQATVTAPIPSGTPATAGAFNPAIGVVFNGQASSFSEDDNNIAGFAIGEEGERGKEGLSLGESEIVINANVDDKFAAQFTGAVASEDGEDVLEIEEAYIQTLGLPYGTNITAGRMLGNLGYMNEKHAHTDDFADRPLPYRAFLNNAFNDEGIQASIVLPTDLFMEIGGGAWRGGDFPASDDTGGGVGSYSAYARVGGDIGDNQNWRIGASYLGSQASGQGRIVGEPGEEITFKGDSNLYIADVKYAWAPTGNASNQELSLQAEYFMRDEDGTYEDTAAALAATPYDGQQSGYYAQALYRFLPQWRVGYRYAAMDAGKIDAAFAGTALDTGGHDPYAHALMVDYSRSEFSRIRLQYNNDHAGLDTDNQFIAQYIMSIGAHAAHKY